ncbi:MAG TPA: radical SAM protein, partial [bacterium]
RSAGEDYGNADAVPFLPYDLYTRLESAAILTSRGCPYRCPFCASHLLCSGYSRRNPIRVVDEMVSIQRTMGAGHFAFYDDALLYQKEAHFVPLLDEWIGRRCEAFLHTPNGIHPKWVDVPLAKLMKRAGFKTVRLGYETQQPTLQQAMGKVTDGDLVQAVSCFLEAGFTRSEIGAYVIMGLPGQTAADILDSILFVMRLGIKIGTAFFSPIPGTASWAEAVRRGFSRDGEDPLLSNHAVFPMRSSSLDLAGFIRIGTLAAMGNRIVSLGGKPTEYPEFTKQLTRLERA